MLQYEVRVDLRLWAHGTSGVVILVHTWSSQLLRDMLATRSSAYDMYGTAAHGNEESLFKSLSEHEPPFKIESRRPPSSL